MLVVGHVIRTSSSAPRGTHHGRLKCGVFSQFIDGSCKNLIAFNAPLLEITLEGDVLAVGGKVGLGVIPTESKLTNIF